MLGPGPRLRMGRKKENPPGLKRLVPIYYFAFSCHPVGTVLRFPCVCVWGGGGAQQLQCKSESAQYSMVRCSRALVRGMGGGLKI